jgi:hypothetical protein
MGAEEGTCAGVLLQQTAQREGNGFGLVTGGELAGGLLDQGDDIGAVYGDHAGHNILVQLLT